MKEHTPEQICVSQDFQSMVNKLRYDCVPLHFFRKAARALLFSLCRQSPWAIGAPSNTYRAAQHAGLSSDAAVCLRPERGKLSARQQAHSSTLIYDW